MTEFESIMLAACFWHLVGTVIGNLSLLLRSWWQSGNRAPQALIAIIFGKVDTAAGGRVGHFGGLYGKFQLFNNEEFREKFRTHSGERRGCFAALDIAKAPDTLTRVTLFQGTAVS